jgi:hypothetical protein
MQQAEGRCIMPTATTTVAIDEFDPLQCCADAAMAALVHDRWLARRLPLLVKAAGFDVRRFACRPSSRNIY